MKRGITAGVDVNARYAAARARIDRMPRLSLARGSTAAVHRASRCSLPAAGRFSVPATSAAAPARCSSIRTTRTRCTPAAVSGGVWKTTNGGASWTATGDAMANLAVNSLAFDPANRASIYAGTGEGYFREDRPRHGAADSRQRHLRHASTPARRGSSSPSTNNSDFDFVNDLVVSTHDPHRLYAATRSGVWRSTDSGVTWSAVLPASVNGGCLDLAFRGDTSSDYLLASCGTFAQATVYRNAAAETNASWDAVLTETGHGRAPRSRSRRRIPRSRTRSRPATLPGPAAASRRGSSRSTAPTTAGRRGTRSCATRAATASRRCCSRIRSPTSIASCSGFGGDGRQHGVVLATRSRSIRTTRTASGRRASISSAPTTAATRSGWRRSGGRRRRFRRSCTPTSTSSSSILITTAPAIRRCSRRMTAALRGPTTLAPRCRTTSVRQHRSAVVFHSLNHNYGATQFYNGAPFPDGLTVIAGAQDNGTLIGGRPRSTAGSATMAATAATWPSIRSIRAPSTSSPRHAHIQRLGPRDVRT